MKYVKGDILSQISFIFLSLSSVNYKAQVFFCSTKNSYIEMRNWSQQIRPLGLMVSTILTPAVASWTDIYDVNERKAGCF